MSNEAPWAPAPALSTAAYSAAELSSDDSILFVLDQLRLPAEETYRRYDDVAGAASSIRDMVVRGAPAIGITAAYGMALAAKEHRGATANEYLQALEQAGRLLNATRPTAVNLAWAVNRCLQLAERHAGGRGEERWRELCELARQIHRDDVAACRRMGEIGSRELPRGAAVLTHCNAGALATGGYGTALGVIRAGFQSGRVERVLSCETRPYLQGARLTAWELKRDGIPVTTISDGMVAHCMQQGMIGAVVVGADRIARNGDVANKIGTYGIACLAKAHDVPMYVAAPWSTVDLDTACGADIPIEQRAARELSHIGERQLVPDGVAIYNPAFDVTPAALIRGIVTERGLFLAAHIADGMPSD